MKKVLLATLFAIAGLAVVMDASALFRRGYNNGYCGRGGCGTRCERSCARSCDNSCNPPVTVTRVEEKPCGPAPCCLTAVKIPADLVKHVEYSWECPTGCVTQNAE